WYGPANLYRHVEWTDNVHVFTEPALRPYPLADGLTLWGAAHCAPANTPGFLDDFRVDRGGVHLALFHGSEQGGLVFEGQAKRPHAPFRAEQIGAAGLHHALLGHYHTPRDAPDHTYPGNPEPLTFGEAGPRGAVLVTVDETGAVTRERHRVAVTEVHDVVVDLDGADHAEAVQDRVDAALAGVDGIVRVRLCGEVAPEVTTGAGRRRRTRSVTAWGVETGEVRYGYDLAALRDEQTGRGQFVRDVEADPSLPDELRRAVLLTGLRAFDGRDDLAVS